jgi:hypothetical protein
MLELDSLVSDFRQFVASHSDTKKLYFARVMGCSPSTLSGILSGAHKPSASQTLAILNLMRGTSGKILHLQENTGLVAPRGNPHQRIEFNDRNADYLENFNRRVDCEYFGNNEGRVPCEGADDDPANDGGDVTDVRQADKTNDPDLDAVFRQLNNLYPQIDNIHRQIGNIIANMKATPNKTGASRRNTSQKFSR